MDTPRNMPTDLKVFGDKLRRLRGLQKMTLNAVAEKIGCTVSMLSKVERGHATPSLQLLVKLTEALGTTLTALFQDEPDAPIVFYRSGERPSIRLGSGIAGGEDTFLERLIPYAADRTVSAHLYTVPPGGGSQGSLTHAGEEVGFVIDGLVELSVDDKVAVLDAGSSFFFASHLAHSYRNIGDTVARILWVGIGPSRD
jgi:transcriptional regulator with XRE-family HTH domain